jgi:(E)-4-hydroxy-3-methyl-but-2-enyl pyrophosphate reductase
LKLYIAENSGFCFGVKGAVKKTIEVSDADGVAYTLGELIHNKQVVDFLKHKNVTVVDDLEGATNKKLVIRSHGVVPSVYKDAESKGIFLIDATCPFVKKIHKIVSEHSQKGYITIIVGDKDHPEVIGIDGWAGGDSIIYSSRKEVTFESLSAVISSKKACIVAQTTITKEAWDDVCAAIDDSLKNYNVDCIYFNTICAATTKRQTSTENLAKHVELMIVVGGINSSNTQKLYSVSKKYCDNTIYIQTEEDLLVKDIVKYDRIGITAGASTPDWVINKVISKIENEGGVIING